MCQLNLYFVPKTLSKSKVLEIMQAAGTDCCEHTDHYEKIPEFKGYNAFISAPQRCNCGSILSKLQYSDYKNFEEFKILSVQREVAELEKIRDFMLRADYSEKREEFETKRGCLSEKMSEQSAWIGKKERVLADEIMIRTDISDEEKSRFMHETVYPVIHKLLKENERKSEVIKAREEYQKFLSDNGLMWKSWAYTLEKIEPQVYRAVPLTLRKAIKLSGYTPKGGENEEDTDGEPSTIIIPSNNIFDVIEVAKKKDFSDCVAEFNLIERFVNGVLKYIDSVKLLAYWQTDECNIKETRIIEASNFTIDSLLFLPYLTVLEIRKTE